MTYGEAVQSLYDLQVFGAKLGLENIRRLAARAGNPHQSLRFIHVAGTNGKGSTCAMLESIYRHAGYRVGLFTSPHLVSFRERIQVNRELIPETEVIRRVSEIQPWLQPPASDGVPATFFEVVTILALLHFQEACCDLVIWETGLGGRLDATNIVTPLASVITNIELDHQKWLGETHAEIAREKAGIIKPNIPVVTAEEKPIPLEVIAETARNRQAPLLRISSLAAPDPVLKTLQLPLLGEHQHLNAALSVGVVRVLSEKLPVSDVALRTGLLEVHWPGRLQMIRQGIGRTLVMDGAHNPSGATALKAALQRYFPGTLATLVFGVMQDKDWPAMCQILMPLAGRIALTAVGSERSASPEGLRDYCQQLNPYAEVFVCRNVSEALQQSAIDPLVVVTGSLHFIGEALEALHLSATPPQNERGLNEWKGSTTRSEKPAI